MYFNLLLNITLLNCSCLFVQCRHVFNVDFCGVAGGFEELDYKVSIPRYFYNDHVAYEIDVGNSNVRKKYL